MLAPPRNTRNNVRLSMWAPCGPVTLTHKTTHHTRLELVTDPPPLANGVSGKSGIAPSPALS